MRFENCILSNIISLLTEKCSFVMYYVRIVNIMIAAKKLFAVEVVSFISCDRNVNINMMTVRMLFLNRKHF